MRSPRSRSAAAAAAFLTRCASLEPAGVRVEAQAGCELLLCAPLAEVKDSPLTTEPQGLKDRKGFLSEMFHCNNAGVKKSLFLCCISEQFLCIQNWSNVYKQLAN